MSDTPVTPIDATNSFRPKRGTGIFVSKPSMESLPSGKKDQVAVETRQVRSGSESSESSNLSSPRRARFAEATAVVSPAVGPGEHVQPFHTAAETKPSDFGFGYISDNNPIEQHARLPVTLANGQPLKSALKSPGTARFINPLSPTFREETKLEKQEESTEKQQAADLKVKTRVRIAKMVLRGVNFSCSLIVLAMLSTTITIFRATRTIPPRNGLPPWGLKSDWPQLVVLSIACTSLLFSIIIIVAYCRKGHKKAERVAVYHTMFAVGYFIFATIMWLVGAVVLQGSKADSNGQDIWGWSCKENKRAVLFQDDIKYALICRLQNWSLICIVIEIVVELIAITIYGIMFYRFWSKHKLRKSMDARDKARSDLYLAQLRTQSAPNTPGFALSPRTPQFFGSDHKNPNIYSQAEEGDSPVQFAEATPTSATTTSPFRLQAPPTKAISATPKQHQVGFAAPPTPPEPAQLTHTERENEHMHAAAGEQVYEAVPIPGAYAGAPQHEDY